MSRSHGIKGGTIVEVFPLTCTAAISHTEGEEQLDDVIQQAFNLLHNDATKQTAEVI